MKILNKLLIASTMVVALGATTSCGNKQTNPAITGSPYTIINFSYLDLPENETESVTFKFNCTGGDDIQFYWGTIEPSKQSSHTFTKEPEYHVVVIKGNVKSISACDEKGTPLENGNNCIESIIFSNTITNIPSKSFLIGQLRNFYIPTSVQSIGDYAFAVSEASSMQYICEPTSRPGGWSKVWCTFTAAEIDITWGLGFYVDSDDYGSTYLISTLNQSYEAYYAGAFKCFTLEKEGIKDLNIPDSVKIGDREYCVSGILDTDGYTRTTLTTLTIPASVQNIAYGAFEDCHNLEKINFAENSQLRMIGGYAFSYCYKLLNVSLPKGVEILSDHCFYYGENAADKTITLTIPNSVRIIDDEFVGDWEHETTAVIYLTSIKKVDEIPLCLYSPFDWTKKVTFKYDSAISKEEFLKKNWPAHDGEHYVWEAVPPTSLA